MWESELAHAREQIQELEQQLEEKTENINHLETQLQVSEPINFTVELGVPQEAVDGKSAQIKNERDQLEKQKEAVKKQQLQIQSSQQVILVQSVTSTLIASLGNQRFHV